MAQDVKVCLRCGTEQPIDNFAWSNKAKGKRKARCRGCCSVMDREYYHNNGGNDAHRRAYLRNRESRITYMKEYKRKNEQVVKYDQLKGTAHIAVYRAIRKGKLVRPERCEKCQVTCKPEAHHHKGYDKEHRLDVLWLCRHCHDLADHPDFAILKMEIEHNVSTDHSHW